MLPLIEVTAVEKGISCGEAREVSARESHIRLPVYDERIDRIIGVLHTLDLLRSDPEQPISDFIRPALYVPVSKSIKELMLELRKKGTVVAIVVDEFGGAEGIVTLEDIMEEVVEDLEDEYDEVDEDEHWVRRMGTTDYIVNARIELDELSEKLGIELRQGRYTTLAGFILNRMHAVPPQGTVIVENNISLTVYRSSAQSVLEVRINW